MKIVVLGLIMLLVSFAARGEPSSVRSQFRDQALASCQLEALRTYPDQEGPFSRKLDQFDRVCMHAKGYHFTVDTGDCGRKDADFYQDPGCYAMP